MNVTVALKELHGAARRVRFYKDAFIPPEWAIYRTRYGIDHPGETKFHRIFWGRGFACKRAKRGDFTCRRRTLRAE